MSTRKLKATLITACCFVVALCSEIKSMDTESDLQKTTSYKTKNISSEGCLNRLKSEIDTNPSNAQLLFNEDKNKVPEPVKSVVNRRINKTKVFACMVFIGVAVWEIYSYFNPITMNKQYLCEDPNYRNWFEDACKWVGGFTIFNDRGLPGNMIGDNTWWHEWSGWPTCACSENQWGLGY